MSTEVMISSAELPNDRNFTWLKTQGLDYLKQLPGNDWTDFNESDPGVTILDQLCYALTELGYCNDFPIKDILCKPDGEIQFENQFFTPEKILTTRPITILDYRKLIIDATPQVLNVYMSFVAKDHQYRVYLYLDDSELAKEGSQPNPSGKPCANDICLKVDRLLAQHRTVGEYFAPAIALTPLPIDISGNVFIDSSASESQVRADIELALSNYISPTIKQLGYQEMLNAGYSSDDIFNGPQLKNGWIPDPEMAVTKRSLICPQGILSLLASIEGANTVQGLKLNDTEEEIHIHSDYIAQFNIKNLTLLSTRAGSNIQNLGSTNLEIGKIRARHAAIKIGSSVDLHPRLPHGKYREIGKYYSVQNTFPPIYGLADNSLPANATPARIAQVRQLKGYLMAFDQLLANQFSQLEHVSELFSFKPWGHRADFEHSQERRISTRLSSSLKHSPDYGIPTQLFSPTYYFQPLYDIPEVKPLLIGNDSYLFIDGSQSSQNIKVQQHNAWIKYKRDPFNQYVSGLRDCMENDTQRDKRHDSMLDHLLARHGESGDFYNDVIRDPHWYGSVLKSRIIIKSLLLQNYQRLSYNRSKAYNFLGAARLGTPGRYRLTPHAYERMNIKRYTSKVLEGLRLFINCGYPSRQGLIDAFEAKMRYKLHPGQCRLVRRHMTDAGDNAAKHKPDYRDGRLKLHSIESAARLHPSKFDNYSSFELLTNLVLQLSLRYKHLSAMLLALINDDDFISGQACHPPANIFTTIYQGMELTVTRSSDENALISDQIQLDKMDMLCIVHSDTSIENTYREHKYQLDWLAEQRQGMVFIENTQLLNSLQPGTPTPQIGHYGAQALFPDYVSYIRTDAFKEQFSKLSKLHIPVYITPLMKRVSFNTLSNVICEYVKWHNNWLKRKQLWSPGDYSVAQQLLICISSIPVTQ